jgi:hypothetical protein
MHVIDLNLVEALAAQSPDFASMALSEVDFQVYG